MFEMTFFFFLLCSSDTGVIYVIVLYSIRFKLFSPPPVFLSQGSESTYQSYLPASAFPTILPTAPEHSYLPLYLGPRTTPSKSGYLINT